LYQKVLAPPPGEKPWSKNQGTNGGTNSRTVKRQPLKLIKSTLTQKLITDTQGKILNDS